MPMATSIDDCPKCKEGYYCSTKAKLNEFTLNVCGDGLLCHLGTKSMYPSLSANEHGELCPAGSYCKRGVKYECPIGTYQPNLGATSCLGCPAGKYCDIVANINPVDCPAGFYCSGIDPMKIGDLKKPCPAGTYSPFEGNTLISDCLPCKEGHYCLEGAVQPTGLCLNTYYCAQGSAT